MSFGLLDLLEGLWNMGDAEIYADTQNFLDEMEKIPEREEQAMKYLKYAAENPDDPIGKIAGLMGKYRATQPLHIWNWKRMREVSEIVGPLCDLIRKIDPEAELDVKLDTFLEENAVLKVKSGRYSEWGIFEEDMPQVRSLMQGIDRFAICPLADEYFSLEFVFKGVRKPDR